MRWIKEIKAVGFFDWCWFVFWLKRNEFHKSVIEPWDRNRAHMIEAILFDLKPDAQWRKAVKELAKNKVNRRFLS